MKDLFYIQWHITNLCNLRCRHCYQHDFLDAAELDWHNLKNVCDNIIATLKKWNRDSLITVTGGEPLIKKEIFALLEYLNNAKEITELNIITNLIMMDDSVISGLKAISKLKKIKFSLEGIDPASNDSIRGRGSFEKIIEKLSIVKKYRQFQIHLMFTVLKNNLRQVPKIFQFAKERQIDGFILERFIPIGQGVHLKDQVLSRDDWRELSDMLLEFCQLEAEPRDIVGQRAFWVMINQGVPKLLGAPCVVGTDGLCIMPDATVFPCRRFDVAIGNLLREGLDRVWQESEILKSLRDRQNLKGKCRNCGIEPCLGCRALAYALTADYLAEDIQCWYE
jgi:radical SAM protein with 4Fe4S-binding SPASM domain